MKRKSDTLFLALSLFSDTGGIQKVCRTLGKAIHDLSEEKNMNFQVLALKDHAEHLDPRYISPSSFKGSKGKKLLFFQQAVKSGLIYKNILLSHIHLLPVAVVIKLLKPGTRIILLAHGIEIWRRLPMWKVWFLKKHTQVWSVSKFTAETIRIKHGIGGKNAYILNNCLDPFFTIPKLNDKPAYLLNLHNLKQDQPIILTICRLTPMEHEKGYLKVMNILKRLTERFPDLCYLLAGDAEVSEKAFLQNLIEQKGLQNHIKLIGFIPQSLLTDYYLLCDVFVLPSKKEGFGLVLTEAAAAGCKIICGNKDGSYEAVLQGCLGTLIDPDDPEALYLSIVNKLEIIEYKQVVCERQRLCLSYFNYSRYKQNVKTLLSHE